MADRNGDDHKKPAECKALRFVSDCPNMKCTYEGWEGESYRCDICGASYKLYYEDMQ